MALEYGACSKDAAAALREPATTAERVDAYRTLGLCSAALDQADAARDAFRAMIAIDDGAELPTGQSPRATSSFREAKSSLVGTVALKLSIETDTVNDGTRTLLLHLTDGLGLVKQLAWRGEGGTLSPPVRAASKLEIDVPTNVDVTLVALDAARGEVVTLELAKPGGAVPVAAAVDDEGVGFTALVIVGAVAGGALLLAGASAVAVALLSPPRTVNVKTDVAFQK